HAPIVAGAAIIGGVGAAWTAAAPFAAALLPAAGVHLFLSMPDGVLRTTARRVPVGIGYVAGLAAGGALFSSRPDFPLWPVMVLTVVAALIAIPPMLTSFRRASGHGRKRMEWLGWGTVVAGGLAVLFGALRVLVQWPPHVGDVAASCTVAVPLGFVAASSVRARHSIDRVLAAT